MREKNTPVTVLLWILTAICLLGTLTRWVPAQWELIPGMPFISSLCAWFLVPILIVFFIALYFHSGSVLIGLIFCLILQGVAIIPNLGHASVVELSADTRERMADMNDYKVNSDDGCARIMTLDVSLGKADPQEIVQMVKDRKVEVLALQRTTYSFNTSLQEAGIADVLPSVVTSDAGTGNMNAIYAMGALADQNTAAIRNDASSAPAGTVAFSDNRLIRFLSVYVDAPQDVNADTWGSELDSINDWAADHASDGMPYVIMGNFGAMFYQHHFSQILDNGFRDAGMRFKSAMSFTWPSTVPMATYDHILANSGVHMGNIETRKITGSDHKAILITIEPAEGNEAVAAEEG